MSTENLLRDEVEITPEMIEAGIAAWGRCKTGSQKEIVEAIFLEMKQMAVQQWAAEHHVVEFALHGLDAAIEELSIRHRNLKSLDRRELE